MAKRTDEIDWRAYDAALKHRGSVTFWFSDEAIEAWSAKRTGRRGTPGKYSDLAIETVLTIRLVYKQRLRQVEGFMESLVSIMRLPLDVPDHTTLSRRGSKLEVIGLAAAKRSDEPLCFVVDSTGLKIYGAGDWHAVKHGLSKRRVWRKLHLGIDASTLEILSVSLTSHTDGDAAEVPELLDQIDAPAGELIGDGAYDANVVYDAAAADCNNGAPTKVVVPPRRGAVLSSSAAIQPTPRDRHVLIMSVFGRPFWEEHTRYRRRLLVENAMGRYKGIIGRRLHGRTTASQCTEVRLGGKALNRMARLGLPRHR